MSPDAGAAAAVLARGLGRRFGSRNALSDIDLRIERGGITGLLGANGAGKSTLLRLVAGLLLPSAGELVVEGLSPVREARSLRKRLGFALEQTRPHPQLRVAAWLRFAAGARGLRGADARSAVDEALARFGLEDVARRALGRCSRGMQQRAALAAASLGDPALLLVDEPSAGLDPLQRESLQSLLAERPAGRTVLLSTHDLEEARRLCDRIAVLHQGRLVAEGTPGELLAGNAAGLFREPRAGAPA